MAQQEAALRQLLELGHKGAGMQTSPLLSSQQGTPALGPWVPGPHKRQLKETSFNFLSQALKRSLTLPSNLQESPIHKRLGPPQLSGTDGAEPGGHMTRRGARKGNISQQVTTAGGRPLSPCVSAEPAGSTRARGARGSLGTCAARWPPPPLPRKVTPPRRGARPLPAPGRFPAPASARPGLRSPPRQPTASLSGPGSLQSPLSPRRGRPLRPHVGRGPALRPAPPRPARECPEAGGPAAPGRSCGRAG